MEVVSKNKVKIRIYKNKKEEVLIPITKKIGDVQIFDDKIIPMGIPYKIEGDNLFTYDKSLKIYTSKKFEVNDEKFGVRIKKQFINFNNKIEYDGMKLYLAHIRGFSNSKTFKGKDKGTFNAFATSVEYFKNLGINAVELMPVYEFDTSGYRMNYWGYTESAYYYAPKVAYGVEDEVSEFRNMVKVFHDNNIKIILQFYFKNKEMSEIEDILVSWKTMYGVDGFRLIGEFEKSILRSPYLSDSILFIEEGNEKLNTLSYNDDFLYNIRNIMIGNNSVLPFVIDHLTKNQKRINYVANVDGMTLRDVVTYSYKHNNENGEGNRDGKEYDFSQNFGVEGETDNKKINALRIRAVKNMLALLYMATGIPLIYMGDEVYRTQYGNNNPYYMDNENMYLSHKNLKDSIEIRDTVKELMKIRKNLIDENYFLESKEEKSYMPNVSLHTYEAWASPIENYDGCFGIYYAKKQPYFIGINFTECTKAIGIPEEVRNMKLLFTTGNSNNINIKDKHIYMEAFSISIYVRER